MIKFGLLGLLGSMVVLLALTLPNDPPTLRRGPVPASQKVAHSSHCAGCHGYDESKMALVDQNGHDVNIFDDWQISMMGMSAYDPFWRATLAHETHIFPNAKAGIETTCLKCHAPLGSIERNLHQLPYSYNDMLSDTLGLDGVSCSSCHQQPAKDLGKGQSGNFSIDTNRVLFGHLPNPFKGPMQIYVGFEPQFSDHIYDSGVCAGCHTLITETLDDQGQPTGNHFVEQATYHEWLNSSYPQQGRECQSCHLPFIQGDVVIATDFIALEGRQPFGLHQFYGANTAMLSLMHDYKDTLGLPKASADSAWNESIRLNRVSLKNAATITMDSPFVANDTLYLHLTIKNKAGHKLPSGYPSRVAWLQVVLIREGLNDTLYANGLMDQSGHITGRDLPFEPHHEICKSAGDVQIYELAMRDQQGQLTTRLNAAYQPLKDNRILPLGFTKTNPVYDTTAIWGNALMDPDYDANSSAGQDHIEYHIALNGSKGYGQLSVALHYQTLPARWMHDIFTNDTVPQVGLFKPMYQDYARFDEIIDQLQLDDIDLNSSGLSEVKPQISFNLMPNPVDDGMIYIRMSPGPNTSDLVYKLINAEGQTVQQGRLE
ncbi:MAG TPA: hypothetical protein VJ508_17045, partial [Saprospiraceae bacterium]|nr:hypothetical protein [Saprospiraceae bacterium]